MNYLPKLGFPLFLVFFLTVLQLGISDGQALELRFQRISPGLEVAQVSWTSKAGDTTLDFVLVRIDSKVVSIKANLADHPMEMKKAAIHSRGVVGINANFFDPSGTPLGLVLSGGQLLHSLRHNGNVLTGVFAMERGAPIIVQRDNFERLIGVEEAVQAGPRLVADRRILQIDSKEGASRRSAVAVTSDGHVLFVVTKNRLPGASLQQFQEFLLEPKLQITDALNLDGGGSSQLYVAASPPAGEIWVSGGDIVPVGLLVTRPTK